MRKFYFDKAEENAVNTKPHNAEEFETLMDAYDDAEEYYRQDPDEYTNITTVSEQLFMPVVKCDYDEGERYEIHKLTTTATNEYGEEEKSFCYVAIPDFIITGSGDKETFSAMLDMMDIDIREEIDYEFGLCSPQTFYDEYIKRHAEKFGEEFEPEKDEPQW